MRPRELSVEKLHSLEEVKAKKNTFFLKKRLPFFWRGGLLGSREEGRGEGF